MVLKKDGDTGRELSKRVSCMQLEKKRTRHPSNTGGRKNTINAPGGIIRELYGL